MKEYKTMMMMKGVLDLTWLPGTNSLYFTVNESEDDDNQEGEENEVETEQGQGEQDEERTMTW